MDIAAIMLLDREKLKRGRFPGSSGKAEGAGVAASAKTTSHAVSNAKVTCMGLVL
jgi:hypothetical protein